jgi:hypothetical protein
MADNTSTQRSVRPGDRYDRSASSSGIDNAANDPLAELARLIGQTDPFAEFGSEARRSPPRSESAMPPGQQASAHEPHAGLSQQSHSAYDHFGESGMQNPDAYGASGYYEEEELPPVDDVYLEGSSSRRRLGILAIAGVFALGVIGTAGAFGYRALFGPGGTPMPPPVIKADTSPSKIVPEKSDERKSGGKVIYDRVGDRGQEKVVSREETPLDIKSNPAVLPPATAEASNMASGTMQAMAGDGSFPEPKKIHTIVIRPDQPDMGLPPPNATASAAAVPAVPPMAAPAANPPDGRTADAQPQQPVPEPPSRREPAPPRKTESAAIHHVQAPPRNAPLSLSPGAQTNSPAPVRQPTRVANASAAAAAGNASDKDIAHGAFVQVSSQRSEADARASFRSLQGKYPKQLGGRHLVVHRIDLGKKGVYYRALVGPFASAGDAAELCGSLKAAGGSCLIQRN